MSVPVIWASTARAALSSDDRRHPEHLQHRRVEAPQTVFDCLRRARRQDWMWISGQVPPARPKLEQFLVRDCAHQLFEKEGIAFAALMEQRSDLRCHVCLQQAGYQNAALVLAQRPDLHRDEQPEAVQFGQCRHQRRIVCRFAVAVGTQYQQTDRSQPGQHVHQHVARGAVDPLKVIEQEHERATCGDCGQKARQRLKETEALLVRTERVPPLRCAESQRQLGPQCGKYGRARPNL